MGQPSGSGPAEVVGRLQTPCDRLLARIEGDGDGLDVYCFIDLDEVAMAFGTEGGKGSGRGGSWQVGGREDDEDVADPAIGRFGYWDEDDLLERGRFDDLLKQGRFANTAMHTTALPLDGSVGCLE